MAEVIKAVKFLRVKMNSVGMLPKGWPEGMLTAMTQDELDALDKNPALRECFQEVSIEDVKSKLEK